MILLKKLYSNNYTFLISNYCSSMTQIKAVLIDLSGTLHVENDSTPDAVHALERLRLKNIPIRFVTNTTKESGQTLYNRLFKIGFKLEKAEIYSSLNAAAQYVRNNNLKPLYLLSKDAMNDFPFDSTCSANQNAVVVGLAPTEFHYENMNKAFKILLNKCPLIAIHEGRYYRTKDDISVGPGCFTKGLEYAASTKAIVVGKPNKYFFESAIPQGIDVEECVMIGDDPNDDIKGAMCIGMKGILVKTGKYMPDVIIEPPPTYTVDNFSAAIELLYEKDFRI